MAPPLHSLAVVILLWLLSSATSATVSGADGPAAAAGVPAALESRVSVPASIRDRDEWRQMERLFLSGRELIGRLPTEYDYQRLSWADLRILVRRWAAHHQVSETVLSRNLAWIEQMAVPDAGLYRLLNLPDLQTFEDRTDLRFVRDGDVLLTPGLRSMWRHCRTAFQRRYPDWRAVLVSGYRSPAYELLLFTGQVGSLAERIEQAFLPYYSRHQHRDPDISVRLSAGEGEISSNPPWADFYAVCRPFGFEPSYPDRPDLAGELSFPGIEALYGPILNHRLIAAETASGFWQAMRHTDFYPSPEGLRVIFALSAQESSIRWNPRVIDQKKALLKQRFDLAFDRIDPLFGGTAGRWLLSEETQSRLRGLVDELLRITDPLDQDVFEYDIYGWSIEAYHFLERLQAQYRTVSYLGRWWLELETVMGQLAREPQTFGLWQINVYHLAERIERYPPLRREFPGIYHRPNGDWRVDRAKLIDALSGVPTSPISRQRTLELMIRTYLQPRYENHQLGLPDDLSFFMAEHIAGELSTFRAAVQLELNRQLGTALVIDGDLSFYRPYSIHIDWDRPSQTQRALRTFIEQSAIAPAEADTALRTLCEAGSWDELQASELYLELMGEKVGLRAYPRIRSRLYGQSPQAYARNVQRKAELFR